MENVTGGFSGVGKTTVNVSQVRILDSGFYLIVNFGFKRGMLLRSKNAWFTMENVTRGFSGVGKRTGNVTQSKS